MSFRRSGVRVLTAGTRPDNAFPPSPRAPERRARFQRRRLLEVGDDWELVVTRPRRWFAVWAAYLGLCLPGIGYGLFYVWRNGFYWGALAAAAAFVALVVLWQRGLVHTIAKVGDQLELHRVFGKPVRFALSDITRLSTIATEVSYRAALGDWWTVPYGYAGLVLRDGTTVGCQSSRLAPTISELVHRARPDLEPSAATTGRPKRATFELGSAARLARMGNNRAGPTLLFGIAVLGFVGFASVMGWLYARPDVAAVPSGPAYTALHELARPHHGTNISFDVDAARWGCQHKGQYMFWDGDSVSHRIDVAVGRPGTEANAADVRSRAEQLGFVAAEPDQYVARWPNVKATLTIGPNPARRDRSQAAAAPLAFSMEIETDCLEGSRAPRSAIEDAYRVAYYVVGAETA